MPEPLDGITVVEMTIAVQGPAAGLYFRDMGADVIKVEPPVGDASRYGRGRDNNTPEGTMGPQFVACNRGKRSICIDLTTPLGLQAVHCLLANADVFLTNYREPALQKMGLDFDALHEKYPGLVYASVNGFGPQGPDADKAMLDGAAVARGGLVGMTGEADRAPSLPGAIIADTAGAMHLALATMTALFSRERHGGQGQRVQTSALGTQLWLQQWELTHVAMTDARLIRRGNHHPNIKGPYGAYRTRDGGAIVLAQTMDQEHWDAFCIFAEVPELAFDPRLQTPGQRLGEGLTEADSKEIQAKLTDAFAQKTALEWDDFLRTQPEIIWERVRDWHEVLEDEQSIANDYVTQVNVPGLGLSKTVGNLVNLSGTPGSVKGDPPELGEANDSLLLSAGLTAEQIAELTAQANKAREEAFALLLGAAGMDDKTLANGDLEDPGG
jgi:crotonobetainyl-CoA:carnitine CoA-transferase CaiB-like acyl-CoA transferase